jgi:diacylglycerol O-acyltransferase 2, plant
MGADGGLNRAAEKPRDGEGGEARVFRCTDYSLPRTTLALALWLGGIHFNVLLVLASLFLLSGRAAAMSVPPIPFIQPPSFPVPTPISMIRPNKKEGLL